MNSRICRVWSGRTNTAENADAYQHVFDTEMLAELHELDGFRGAYLLRRDHDAGAEFVTLTFFDSLDDVRGFAGADLEAAHVSEAGRNALDDFDSRVRHFTVVTDPLVSAPLRT